MERGVRSWTQQFCLQKLCFLTTRPATSRLPPNRNGCIQFTGLLNLSSLYIKSTSCLIVYYLRFSTTYYKGWSLLLAPFYRRGKWGLGKSNSQTQDEPVKIKMRNVYKMSAWAKRMDRTERVNKSVKMTSREVKRYAAKKMLLVRHVLWLSLPKLSQILILKQAYWIL